MKNNSRIISKKKRIVIKLSGSIFSQGTQEDSIKKYAQMLSHINKKVQLVIITGGGEIARHYINLARNLGSDEASLDSMGIEVSRLNAKLLMAALKDLAYSQVPTNLENVVIAAESGKIVIVGGLHPGQSTNATSALIAEKVKASIFLMLLMLMVFMIQIQILTKMQNYSKKLQSRNVWRFLGGEVLWLEHMILWTLLH